MTGSVILAVSKPSPDLAVSHGVDCTALLRVGRQTLGDRILKTLRTVDSLGPVAALGPDSLRDWSAQAEIPYRSAEPDLMAALLDLVDELGDPDHLLLAPADAPLVTSSEVAEFVGQATGACELAYGLVPFSTLKAEFPACRWVSQRFREGDMVLTRFAVATPDVLSRASDTVSALLSGQMKFFDLVKQFGTGFLLSLAMGSLSLRTVEQKLSTLLGAKCSAVVSQRASLAFTVSDVTELRCAEERLGND